MPRWFLFTLKVVLAVALPTFLVLTNVRLLMTPLFPDIIYHQPWFPDDPYGFTREERLYWSKQSIAYILSDPTVPPIELWRFPTGQTAPEISCQFYLAPRDCSFFYNDREVKHMIDVQVLTGYTINVWVVAGVLTLMALAWLGARRQWAAMREGVLWGSGATLGLLAAVVLGVLVSFDALFVQFHEIFFEPGTWTFYWSDSLIRLFPVEFWFSAFLFVGVASIIYALVIGALAWRLPTTEG